MMAEYVSPYSSQILIHNKGDRIQYRDYLQSHRFADDISGKVCYGISAQSREIIATREELTKAGYELRSGFHQITETLSEPARTEQLATAAVDIWPSHPESLFVLAKSHAVQGRVLDGLRSLEVAIRQDRNYAVKAATDIDFLQQREKLNELLERLRNEAKAAALSNLTTAQDAVGNLEHLEFASFRSKRATEARSRLNEALEESKRDTYFGWLIASENAREAEACASLAAEELRTAIAASLRSRMADVVWKCDVLSGYEWLLTSEEESRIKIIRRSAEVAAKSVLAVGRDEYLEGEKRIAPYEEQLREIYDAMCMRVRGNEARKGIIPDFFGGVVIGGALGIPVGCVIVGTVASFSSDRKFSLDAWVFIIVASAVLCGFSYSSKRLRKNEDEVRSQICHLDNELNMKPEERESSITARLRRVREES